MNKSFLFLSATALALMLAGCSKSESEAPAVPLVRLVQVQSDSEAELTTYPGRTQASKVSHVAFKVSGTIDQVLVNEGQAVQQGQVLARMDSRDYEVQYNAIKAEYEQTKAECERIIGLYEDGSTTASNYDKARYGLEQITMKYQHAKDQLADCEIVSPFSGYVHSILHESHETVSAGMPVVAVFTVNGLEVVINIPTSEYVQANRFSSYMAQFDVLPGVSFPLRLLSISPRANANQLYEVRFQLQEAEVKGALQRITPGMTAFVSIQMKSDESEVVEVPVESVFHQDNDSYVFVYQDGGDGTGSLVKTLVEVGSLRLSGKARIMKGLHAGQQVVWSGVHHLVDGQVVRPNPQPSSSNVGGLL